jgi:diguanylate cyclase (GGDEF)-like protein
MQADSMLSMVNNVSSDKSQEIAARLQALKDAYLSRMPDELQQLNALVAELSHHPQATEPLTQLNHRLHKLAGSAGSFGLHELGKLAKQLELQTVQWLNNQALDEGKLKLFALAINSLEGLVSDSKPKAVPLVSKNIPTKNSNLIYILEDDLDVANELAITLRHFGHEVQHFHNLAVAEAEILRRPPDFMICDIMFTEEGRETPVAVAALQQQLPNPVPVIFMSTRDDFQAYHDAVRAGAVGYFVKPLDIIRLVDCFEYYLDRNRSAPYRVLIVDDDAVLGEHYKLVLSAADIRAEVIQDPALIFEVLEDFHPELILLDLNMPTCSGTELAQVIRLNPEWLRIPITYLSSEIDVDKRVIAMGRAGDDFLTKPMPDRELVAAVSVRAARCRQLSDALDRDSLTGLLKHSRIKELVDLELSRARRSSEKVSLVMLDLDHFKQVNDVHGHAAGDKVIKAMAHLLRQRLRKTDSLGRYGGEEFLVILPRCGQLEAQALINNVREHFSSLPFQASGQHFHVTMSAGIASYEGGEPASDRLLEAADEALYAAKSGGRNQVCLA